MMLASLLFMALGDLAMADLRWASWPKGGWKLRKEHSSVPFRHPKFPLYSEPSDFNYEKLKKQRARNYDNFLRSNIDNEQDNRNFDTEDGKDHLPFRSYETAATDQDQRLKSDGGLSAMEIATRTEMSELQSPTLPKSPPASCWVHFPSNCSRHKGYDASDGWKRDSWGEQNRKTNVDETACLNTRKEEYNNWCAVKDAMMHYIAPLASAPPKPTNPPPASCWTYMPTGCPRQHSFDGSSEWSRDYHGERHKNTGADENACLKARKEELNNWCGVTNAETFYFKPLASAPPKPTSPPASCWTYSPTGCPKQQEHHGASGWSRDLWGEERRKTSVDENACLNTRKAEFNNWCGVANTEMHFIAPDPKSTVLTMMSPANPLNNTGVTEAGNYIDVTEGEAYVVPLRWNNPHSAELEVNIWIMKNTQKYVVPIMKPTCSGEGYQNNVFDFKIPKGFPKDVCNQPRDCVLQVYAHSVESRMYASGTPIIVKGTGPWTASEAKDPELDVAFDLHKLRPLCLSRGDKEAHHTAVNIYKARLSSDVYNHAYQNSDFSPYAGQQPQHISQNLQAACILKMTANNFGELGKTYMQKIAPQARHYAHKLDRKARHLIEKYEKAADQIINGIKYNVANNDTISLFNVEVGREGACATSGVRHDPIGSRTVAASGVACQQRCLNEGGVFFNFWPNGGCHCSTASATERIDAGNPTEVSGSMTCDARILFQETAHCFRCKDVGSTTTRRHNTNTYIPSFEIEGKENINKALDYVTGAQLKSGFMQNPASGTMSAVNDEKATVNIYMAVLLDMWDEFKMASDGTYAANHCPSGQESASEASCLEEARKLLPAGTGQGRTTLISGSWGHAPPGCSIQSGGDWAAHYNKHGCGQNDGGYSLVCVAAGQATNETEQTQEDKPPKECPAGQESVSEAKCLEEAKKLIPEGKEQRRKTLVTGRWGHVPAGCTLYDGDWAAHYNQNHCGNGHKQFKPICQAATGEKEDPLDKFKFTYRGPVFKTTTATLSDENGGVNRNYRKRDADDKPDGGYYSAEKAWHLQNRINGSSTPVPKRAGPLAQSRMYGQTLKYPPLAPAAVGCNASGASLMEGEDTNLVIGILRTLSKDKRAAVLATIGAEPMPRERHATVDADGHLNVGVSEKQRPHLMRTLAEGRSNVGRAPRPGLMRTRTPQDLSLDE